MTRYTTDALTDIETRTQAGYIMVTSATAPHVTGDRFACTGTADQERINAAIDQATASGGTVLLSAGTFNLSGSIVIKDNVELLGIGVGTVLSLNNSVNLPMITTTGSGETFYCRIAHMRFEGNKANNTTAGSHAVNMRNAHGWRVSHCHIKNAGDRGVNLEGNGGGTGTLALDNHVGPHNRIDGAKGVTVEVGAYAPNNHVHHNIIGGSDTSICLEIRNNEIIIAGNHIHNAAQEGVLLSGEKNQFENNVVESSGYAGIHLELTGSRVIGNTIFNNGKTTRKPGINMNPSCVDCLVFGNRMYDNQGTKTQNYGIVIESGAAGCTIAHNHLRAADQLTGSMLNSATGNMIRDNQGFVTEAKGTATVASGQTTIAVTHGLATTPALTDIQVTPTNNLGSAAEFWVSTPTSTQFTINVNVDPGATTATFVWQAQVL